MSTQSQKKADSIAASTHECGTGELEVVVTSFGYKQGPPPLANVVFDVRFLKNPFWVDELRPLTGLDAPVQEYVLEQPLAQDFLDSMLSLFGKVLPKVIEHKIERYIIALGCTGGQHRSTTLVEAMGRRLREQFPHYSVTVCHRELDGKASVVPGSQSSAKGEQ